ncbi:membrane protein [Bordetella holmesii F627]|nr:membrane protein [Bordetella holmesii F627]
MQSLVRNGLVLAALSLSAASFAQDALGEADKHFLERAIQGGYAEIAGGKLAAANASTRRVKQFGELMITDHARLTDDLLALARKKGVQPPEDLSFAQKGKLAVIAAEGGSDFDKAYVDQLAVAAHEDAIKLFQQTESQGKDEDVKAFLAKALPVLQQHLDMARTLQGQKTQ